MSSQENKYPRKQFLIFPKFQLTLLGVNLGVLVVISLLTWVAIENALSDLTPAAALSGSETEFFRNYLVYQTKQVRLGILLSLVGGLLISGGVTLLLSHRFAGPLVRLRNHFKQIAGGADPIPELSFRDGDFLGDLPPIINDAMSVAQGKTKREERGRA